MKKIFCQTVLISAFTMLLGCYSNQQWALVVYNDHNNIVDTYTIDGFDSKQSCEAKGSQEYATLSHFCLMSKYLSNF
jgi:hypothetical protein